MKKFRTLMIALLCAGCVIISGCGNDTETSVNTGTETKTEAETVTPEQDDSNTNPDEDTENAEISGEETPENSDEVTEENPEEVIPEPVEPAVPEFVNKLTGLETTEALSKVRPVSIMINNLKQALPQQGISQADVIYEVLELEIIGFQKS